MDFLIYRLLLITILYRMAFSFTTESPLFDDEDPYDEDERDEGVIVNTGGEGVAETDALKHMDDVERKKANALIDDDNEDIRFQGQVLYQEWLEDCATNNESTPYIPDDVLQYMSDNNLSVEDQLITCKSMRDSGGKRKRFLKKGAGIWDKCIIPYTFDKSFDDGTYESNRMETLRVHKLFRLTTGFRFVEYNNTNSQLGLDHNNYINYEAGNHPCSSPSIGNSRTWNGQWLKACGAEYLIIHELGHALGFAHETEGVAGITSGVMFPNTNNMHDNTFRMYEEPYTYHDPPFFYLTSRMGAYPSYSTVRGYGYRWQADEQELTKLISKGDSYYYYFKDLQEFNKCYDEFDSCSPLPVCAFGGYPSVVNDVCTCICPEGLNPDTKCSTLTEVINDGSWPAGTFALVMVKGATCPKGLSLGQMTRWNHDKIWKKGTSLSKGSNGDWEFVFDVCTQTTSSTDSEEWPAGEYCLLKRGDCPKGFEEGLAETWGKVPARENSSYGELPDGKKGQDFEFRFCCRNDGHNSIPISLPNRKPFILYAKYENGCQKVKGMHETREAYVTSEDTTKSLTYSGSLPYFSRKYKGFYSTYYCVYKPVNMGGECGGIKNFSPGEKIYTFTSPNYPEAYSQNSKCLWHFESPKGTTMKIEFDDFEVSTKDDSSCKSYVELRTVNPGSSGYRICGHYEKKPRLTVYNSLVVKFATSSDNVQKGFKATVTVLSESEQCYPGNGTKTYVGTMNYTRSFRPCLPWSKVTHCMLHQFSHYTMDQDLNNNYCRNTMGRMPWCYVNAELCERENCDVCMRDRCYDVLPHCASIVEADADFCSKNDLGEAKRTCMKTCGFCKDYKPKPAYTTVTCSAPGAVTEINPAPVKTSYNVGEQVSYSCPSSHVVRKRICQSDGTWSHLGYVCSGCSDGWTYVRGRCFQYQKNALLNYWYAKELCEGLNSTLAVVDSDEQATEVMELENGDIRTNDYVYIGIQQKDGVWVGDDGSIPKKISWDPNHTPNPSNCLCGKGYQTLHTTWCGYKLYVMCSRKPTEPFVCEDDFPNCPEILAQHPGLCEEYPDYAWTNCRKTCGVSGCSKTSSCTIQNVENGKQIHGSSNTIKQGQYVEYKCNDGFQLKSGNLNRTCLSTGSFNGDLPVCSVPEEAASITLFTGVDFFRRATYLGGYFNYPEVFNGKQYRIPTTGKITAWQFFASEAGEITFFVWRQNENSNLDFTLVGKNTLTVKADNRAVTMAVSADDQIAAKAGDVIGLVLPSKPVITFSKCDKGNLPQFTTWLTTSKVYYAADMTVGTSYAFKEYKWNCRVYSINAVLQPTS